MAFLYVVDESRNGETMVIGLILRRHNLSDFVKPVTSKGLSINDILLNPDDLEMYIDLAPFVNPSPYVVPEDMSLTKDNEDSSSVELQSTSVRSL
ncbi:hypothetical protein E3N88_28376 [Mikania micrantha]|uniref:Uncharacterized protein n=1 Tax=Mikania micrantha TaxID=192012 RepID=A0A5N6N260_9ASTR|nr:hypothetical protein E3N88_28376 [Mikania micrantha]